MKKFSEYIKWFMYITTSILIVCTVIFGLYNEESIPGETLWQILLSGFLTTLVTVIFRIGEGKGGAADIFRYVLHYILLCVVMIVCGNWFGWLKLDFAGIGMMLGAVAVVYLLTFLAYYFIDLKQANDINKKLKDKYGDEE